MVVCWPRIFALLSHKHPPYALVVHGAIIKDEFVRELIFPPVPHGFSYHIGHELHLIGQALYRQRAWR